MTPIESYVTPIRHNSGLLRRHFVSPPSPADGFAMRGEGSLSWNFPADSAVTIPRFSGQNFWEVIMRSVLLWAIGIPLPIILILWLVTGHA